MSTVQAPDSGLIARLRADAEPLRLSFGAAVVQQPAFAEAFYQRLFELAPATRALFPADLQPQREKFAQTLTTIVEFIDDPAALIADLRRLGARHVAYGAQPGHYAAVGEALLYTLESHLEGGLAEPARRAWRRLYAWIVAEMLSGAQVPRRS